MRLHLLSLPWTNTTEEYLHCAYTQKVVKFGKMMRDHEVILYSNEENTTECAEHVTIFSEEVRRALFGAWDENNTFDHITWEEDDTAWKRWNQKASQEVFQRAAEGDILLLLAPCHALVAQENPSLVPVEWAVGYGRCWAPFRIYESYAWMHSLYGHWGVHDGAFLDAVVPNFFDPEHFEIGEDEGHLLFMGRMIERKGVRDAVAIADAAGLPITLAGPGISEAGEGFVYGPALDSPIVSPNIRYHGPANLAQRKVLMGGATATLMPTRYIEPFGGVAIEAMMSGSPVIATDFGAFTETVEEGLTGFRYRTIAEAADYVKAARALDPYDVRARAIERFSLAAVAPQFTRVFERLRSVSA